MIWAFEAVGLTFAAWQAVGLYHLYRDTVWTHDSNVEES